jgi:hypothetical protein
MFALKHKVFELGDRRESFWGYQATGAAGVRQIDFVRRQAEEFAGRIGAENVISVVEHGLSGLIFNFTVTLWYREEQEAKAKPVLSDELFESPSYR